MRERIYFFTVVTIAILMAIDVFVTSRLENYTTKIEDSTTNGLRYLRNIPKETSSYIDSETLQFSFKPAASTSIEALRHTTQRVIIWEAGVRNLELRMKNGDEFKITTEELGRLLFRESNTATMVLTGIVVGPKDLVLDFPPELPKETP